MDVASLRATQREMQPTNGHLNRITERCAAHHLDMRAGNEAQFHQATLDAGLGVNIRNPAPLTRGKAVERPPGGFLAMPKRTHTGDLIRPISLTSESCKQVAPQMSQPPGSWSAQVCGLAR